MKGNFGNLAVTICSLALVGGCATSAIDTTAPDDGDVAVIGKFELIRNGAQVDVGEGFFANHATLLFSRQGEGEEIVGTVGSDGQFTWYLAPGDYHVSAVSFSNRGERVEPDVSLNFSVAPDAGAVYIGTISLETSFDNGYFGTDARLSGATVQNDCNAECANRLRELDLSNGDLVVSMLHRPGR